MAILIHRDPMIKHIDYDNVPQSVSNFNNIPDIITIIDQEYLNIVDIHPNEELQYIVGIMISLVGIYYFVYEIIKKVSG